MPIRGCSFISLRSRCCTACQTVHVTSNVEEFSPFAELVLESEDSLILCRSRNLCRQTVRDTLLADPIVGVIPQSNKALHRALRDRDMKFVVRTVQTPDKRGAPNGSTQHSLEALIEDRATIDRGWRNHS